MVHKCLVCNKIVTDDYFSVAHKLSDYGSYIIGDFCSSVCLLKSIEESLRKSDGCFDNREAFLKSLPEKDNASDRKGECATFWCSDCGEPTSEPEFHNHKCKRAKVGK